MTQPDGTDVDRGLRSGCNVKKPLEAVWAFTFKGILQFEIAICLIQTETPTMNDVIPRMLVLGFDEIAGIRPEEAFHSRMIRHLKEPLRRERVDLRSVDTNRIVS